MKRTLFLIGILATLAAIYFLFIRESGIAENEFHISDTSNVGRLELKLIVKGEEKAMLTLNKISENQWRVNGQYGAITKKVDNFLEILGKIRVFENVAESGQGSALTILKRNHTLVEIFDSEGKVIKSYLVGATNSRQTANIMMIKGANKAFLVSRPGTEGYVSVYYNTEIDVWREKLLFDVEGKDLRKIQVEYAGDAPGYELKRASTDRPWYIGEGLEAEETRAKGYEELFTGKISAESFANKGYPIMRDSLEKRMADITFSYETFEGKSLSVLLFVRPDNPNNFFGYLPGKPELYTIQHFVIDKFLKSRDYFIKQAL